MAKRKRDYDDSGDNMNRKGGDDTKADLRDFVIEEKLTAFINAYSPAPDELDDTCPYVESFDDARLREFFKAYFCDVGDPLMLYIKDLTAAGFKMRVSLATGEPCFLVVRR